MGARMHKSLAIIFLCTATIFSCKQNQENASEQSTEVKSKDVLFELKDNKTIGIDFANILDYDKDFNVYKYRNFYNGGGVAIGDINNDGLVDIYMVSNQKTNKLYLNKGNWKFEDITQKAGVGGTRSWSTGVAMADVNGDGLMDIYVCNSGDVHGDNKENELFINKGDLSFEESAAKYNLNDKGFSTHASFFDYDKDGDLDCYILNNSFRAIGSFDLKLNQRNKRDELGGDKLMENRNGKFVDVSAKAGIYGSVVGFGLGITIGDVNNDNWEDIYISNDFFERDYLYINQKNGTFKEDLTNQIPAISGASMGADIADINNDGFNDIFVTEMLPTEYKRLKTLTTFDDWNRYQASAQNGYHYQFTRNTLQVNNGNNTFSELSRFAGVEASDWSWGALFFDMENDGNKDLFIANGIYKDLTNQDYLQYAANDSVMGAIIRDKNVDYKKLIDIIPSNKVANQSYRGSGKISFSNYTSSGLNTPGFSNGSAYGDIDNDGDLDLIVNNVNMPCFVYENKANTKLKNNYLKFVLTGNRSNKNAVGAKIEVVTKDNKYYYENQPVRGFQSSMDNRPNVGVGTAQEVDIIVTWPSGKVTKQEHLKVNQIIKLDEKDGLEIKEQKLDLPKLLKLDEKSLVYNHKEKNFNDFNRENLLYHMLSNRGPCASTGDLNGDKVSDLVIPGASGMKTQVFLSTTSGMKENIQGNVFSKTIDAEEVKCDLFDADKDGDLDLYLASGSNELSEFSPLLYDELLFNDGKGNFTFSGQMLPSIDAKISTGAICHSDIDNDGDIDLFVGERVKINKYGESCSGYILLNNGKGQYEEKTANVCPALKEIGMITDAIFQDLDGDNKEDLIVVGEFMNITIFKNDGKKLSKVDIGINKSGWYNVVKAVDIDNDKDLDLVIGNHGLNSRFKADDKYPISMYFSDYDNNGFPEGILTKKHADGKNYPYALRQTLMSRIPGLKKKFPNFESYKTASITEIFSKEQLDIAKISQVNELRSIVLINNGNMKFEARPLPDAVQISPMYAIANHDINGDGFQDLIMGGNLYNVQPEMGKYDASYGHILINDGKGNFQDKAVEMGFSVKGEIRDIKVIDNKIIVFRNNNSAVSYQINKQ